MNKLIKFGTISGGLLLLGGLFFGGNFTFSRISLFSGFGRRFGGFLRLGNGLGFYFRRFGGLGFHRGLRLLPGSGYHFAAAYKINGIRGGNLFPGG